MVCTDLDALRIEPCEAYAFWRYEEVHNQSPHSGSSSNSSNRDLRVYRSARGALLNNRRAGGGPDFGFLLAHLISGCRTLLRFQKGALTMHAADPICPQIIGQEPNPKIKSTTNISSNSCVYAPCDTTQIGVPSDTCHPELAEGSCVFPSVCRWGERVRHPLLGSCRQKKKGPPPALSYE